MARPLLLAALLCGCVAVSSRATANVELSVFLGFGHRDWVIPTDVALAHGSPEASTSSGGFFGDFFLAAVANDVRGSVPELGMPQNSVDGLHCLVSLPPPDVQGSTAPNSLVSLEDSAAGSTGYDFNLRPNIIWIEDRG